MNGHKTLNLTLAVLCFVIVWSINEHILSLFSLTGKAASFTIYVKIISAAGIFVFLFQLIMTISYSISDKIFSKESKITGEWYQIFQIQNYSKSDNKIDCIRHGHVSITNTANLLEIAAINMKLCNTSIPSSWHSNKVTIQGSQVWLLFSSNGPGRGSTHGNMLYHIQGKKPQKMIGQFSDSSPATHYGSIELYRNKSDYEKRLNELKEVYA